MRFFYINLHNIVNYNDDWNMPLCFMNKMEAEKYINNQPSLAIWEPNIVTANIIPGKAWFEAFEKWANRVGFDYNWKSVYIKTKAGNNFNIKGV